MRDIQKEYFGNRVLKGVSIRVEPGKIYSIVGENGAGKSTLMNILFGMPVIHNTGILGGDLHGRNPSASPLPRMRWISASAWCIRNSCFFGVFHRGKHQTQP
jgi:ABC-type branched-subunit amino acid transport system ATPase component